MLLRRRFALLPLALTLSLACEKPPAGDTTTPTDATPKPTDTKTTEPADATPEAPLPDANEVLAKSIDALGGRAAVEAVESSYTEAKTEIKSQNMTVVTRIWAKGDAFYMESDMQGMGLTQMWMQGEDVWSKDPVYGMRKLEGKEAAQARWAADPLLAANWKKYFEKAETIGRSKNGEQELVEVELSSASGDALVLIFDAKTSLPAGQAFKQETQMGALPVKIAYSDYRDVQGVKVPFNSVTDLKLMVAEQTIEKYEINVPVDDAKLAPPEPGSPAAEPADTGKGKTKTKTKTKPKEKAAPKDKAAPKAGG